MRRTSSQSREFCLQLSRTANGVERGREFLVRCRGLVLFLAFSGIYEPSPEAVGPLLPGGKGMPSRARIRHGPFLEFIK